MTTETENTTTVPATTPTHELKRGDRVDTRYGVAEIESVDRKHIRGKYRLVFGVYVSRYGRRYEWTSRKMTFARGGRKQEEQTATEQTATEQTATEQTTTEQTTTATAPAAGGGLAEMLASAIGPHIASKIDRDDVVEIINERLSEMTLPRSVVVQVADAPEVDMGVQHTLFEPLLRLVANRLNVWLVGPAGSGKTSVAGAVAEAMGLPFYSTSVCAMTSKADLVGYRNVSTGEYVRTDLREAFENGGVFLIDEIDAGNPNVMVILNNLLANAVCSFPDGMVRKHADFVLLSGANTIGLGADSQYVGRNQLDKATVDRFVMVPFGYDPAIEAAMAGVPVSAFAGMPTPERIEFLPTENVEARCELFCRRLVAIRTAISELRVRHVVSPRATKAGCTMLRAGFPMDTVMQWGVWKGLDEDTVAKVTAAARLDEIV